MNSITNPNEPEEAAGFQKHAIKFDPEDETYILIANIYTPPVDASFSSVSACRDTTHFTNTSDTADVDSVRWYFGDGDSSDTWHAMHAYDTPGTYFVRMKAWTSDGQCQGQVWRSDSVVVTQPARAGFYHGTTTYRCEQALVHMTDTSGNSDSVLYDYGDGQFRDTSVFAYDSSGTYTVRQLAFSPGGCPDTAEVPVTVHVDPAPEASFTWHDADTAACLPYALPVSNESKGAVEYRWLLNDTELDSGTTPEPKISEPGTYDVSLIAYNSQHCPDTMTITSAITTVHPPAPEISYERDTLCGAQEVAFAAGYDNADQFEWHFHDGSASAFIETSKTYEDSGLHEVMLITSNEVCSDTAVTEVHAAIEPYPESSFAATDTAICTPHEVGMINNSSHADDYSWHVTGPEEHTSESEAPAFTLTEAGSYDVQLISHNTQSCSDTLLKQDYLQVYPPVEASFETEDTAGCAHVAFQFTDRSAEATEWQWSFGDGNTSDAEHPQHVYRTEGHYDITLIASNAGCSDTAESTEPVAMLPAPRPAFTISDTAVCAPSTVSVSNEAEGDIVDLYYTTSRGDTLNEENPELTFEGAGTVLIYQHLESSNGCRPYDSAEVIISDPPVSSITVEDTISNCGEERWHFSSGEGSNMEHSWYINDEHADSGSAISHTFTEDGTYELMLISSRNFCRDTLTRSLDVDIRPEAEADFYAPSTEACLPGDVAFENESEYADRFTWYFGKGSPHTVDHSDPVEWRYEESGLYTIRLAAESDEGCRDTLVRQYYINIVDSVRASFSMDEREGCRPLDVSFSNESYSGDADAVYRWSFGTGDSSTVASPDYIYNRDLPTGTYDVTLTASNEVCTDTARSTVHLTGFDGDEDGPGMHAVTVRGDDVAIHWEELQEASKYYIYRGAPGGNWRRYAETSDTMWVDAPADPSSEVHHYRVHASDACGNTSAPSRHGRNIMLQGSGVDNLRALLNWNGYSDWQRGVHEYAIERRPVEGEYSLLHAFEGTAYTDEDYFREGGLGYCYRVRAYERGGTGESLSNALCLPYESALYVPNAFSPNDDGHNDEFEVQGPGVEEYEIRIFNRWGSQVYHSTDMDSSWDGTYDGREAPEGVYLYTIRARGADGQNLNREGSLMLIR